MKRLWFFIFLVLITCLNTFIHSVNEVEAITDPLASPNNKYGIHIIDEHDLDDAARLVNSSGGEWGYVTMVVRIDDRKKEKWQNIFNRMRTLKLIPIIRLATVLENGAWQKPRKDDATSWAAFLNSLNWVVQNRYIILFNEPNHASEWGGEIKPEEYAEIIRVYRDALKQQSDDFFILLGAMDEATATNKTSFAAAEYLRRMVLTDSDIFTLIDGISVHSYPNPAFSGSPFASGRATIRSYEWLINYLAQYKLNRDSPIFITETGWINQKDPQTIASYFNIAFSKIWLNTRIVAITPFILNYQDAPFDQFSWRMKGSASFYPQYESVQQLAKIAGRPKQIVDAEINLEQIPNHLNTDFLYMLPIIIRNKGQAVWDEEYPLKLHIISSEGLIGDILIDDLLPMHERKISLPIKTPSEEKIVRFAFQLFDGEQRIGKAAYKQVEIVASNTIWSKIARFLQ